MGIRARNVDRERRQRLPRRQSMADYQHATNGLGAKGATQDASVAGNAAEWDPPFADPARRKATDESSRPGPHRAVALAIKREGSTAAAAKRARALGLAWIPAAARNAMPRARGSLSKAALRAAVSRHCC